MTIEHVVPAGEGQRCRVCDKFLVNCVCPTDEEPSVEPCEHCHRPPNECKGIYKCEDVNEQPEQEHFNMMPPEDELEWLRGQYVQLKGMLDEARQGYATAGQEASALRRVLAAKAPTLRERAAIAVIPSFLMTYSVRDSAARAVVVADELIRALNGEQP